MRRIFGVMWQFLGWSVKILVQDNPKLWLSNVKRESRKKSKLRKFISFIGLQRCSSSFWWLWIILSFDTVIVFPFPFHTDNQVVLVGCDGSGSFFLVTYPACSFRGYIEPFMKIYKFATKTHCLFLVVASKLLIHVSCVDFWYIDRVYQLHWPWDHELWRRLYTTYIRLHLEFAVAAWNPCHKGDIVRLEAVQRRASKIPGSIIRGEVQVLDLQRLSKRREVISSNSLSWKFGSSEVGEEASVLITQKQTEESVELKGATTPRDRS